MTGGRGPHKKISPCGQKCIFRPIPLPVLYTISRSVTANHRRFTHLSRFIAILDFGGAHSDENVKIDIKTRKGMGHNMHFGPHGGIFLWGRNIYSLIRSKSRKANAKKRNIKKERKTSKHCNECINTREKAY